MTSERQYLLPSSGPVLIHYVDYDSLSRTQVSEVSHTIQYSHPEIELGTIWSYALTCWRVQLSV